ncbi:MAG: TIGR03067 domain-containing protein [Planctomycetota bacterium]|nr:MAG: TIGR03067 domain-containing protein [Planctomycetota bacterium]
MNRLRFSLLVAGASLLVVVSSAAGSRGQAADTQAADAKQEAIKKDHLAIEGTWRAVSVEVNGNALNPDDIRKITTENGRDGEWTLVVDGNEIAEGTSTIDPTVTPRTIDFMATKGNNAGQTTFGIYEMIGNTRKICYAEPGRPRPAEFSAPAGSGRLLVVFERVEVTK